MKKILKKFLCLFLCAVFSLSLFSFVSCSGAVVNRVLAAVARQKFAAVTLNADVAVELKENQETRSYDLNLNAAVNVEKQDGDVVLSAATKQNDALMQNTYNYLFVREGEFFYPDSQEKVTDWTGVKLQKEEDIFKRLEELLSSYGLSAEDLFDESLKQEELFASLNESMAQGIVETISFYEFMDAISVEGDKLVIDLNKMLYTFVLDFANVFGAINDDTTIEDVLRNGTVERYMEFFLRDFTADELQGNLQDGINVFVANNSLTDKVKADVNALAQIKPDVFSSAYDYVVKVLCSDEFNAVVNDFYGNVFKAYFGEYFSTTETEIGGLLEDVLGKNWQDELGDAFKGITERQFAISIESFEIILKDLKQEYVLNDDFSVKSVALGGAFTLKQGDDEEMTLELSYVLNGSAQETELIDINQAVIETQQMVFPDGVSQNSIHLAAAIMSEKVFYTSMYYALYPVYENNELVGFDVYNEGSKMSSSFDKETGTLSFDSNLQNEFVTFAVQIHTYENGIYVDIFGRENVANGYAYAFLSDGTLTTISHTIEEYLLQN